MKTWVMKAMLGAVAGAMVLSTNGSASAWWHHRTVTSYAALPSVPVTTVGYAPVVVSPPVVSAPVVAASPVVTAGYAPTLTYSAPVTAYSPVTTYSAYSAPV